jgi:alpha-amylase/alpha-mannosidase (GH57 family)
MEQSHGFSQNDNRELLMLVGDEISAVLPRYRKLAQQGKIELSITPWSHPILPLLLDFESARESIPDVSLPPGVYPGGEDRCNWHLRQAIAYFERHFGMSPAGCWPSEGGLSQPTLELLEQHGFRWTASGTNVLRNTLGEDFRNGNNQHQIWSAQFNSGNRRSAGAAQSGIACVFRDDELSDLPGFVYSNWRAEDAVNDLVYRLEQIHEHSSSAQTTVSIIMDGENAWEYYPENGQEFLTTLYSRLSTHPRFRLSTFSELLDDVPCKPLPRLVAGSWVYGTFSVWIGHPAKNRAWDLLIKAKKAVDRALDNNQRTPLPVEQILEQLSVCESSDWFWWLGEEGRAEDGPAFDELFRVQLRVLYRLIGEQAPDVLDRPIDDTHAAAEDGNTAGTMRQANQPGL